MAAVAPEATAAPLLADQKPIWKPTKDKTQTSSQNKCKGKCPSCFEQPTIVQRVNMKQMLIIYLRAMMCLIIKLSWKFSDGIDIPDPFY